MKKILKTTLLTASQVLIGAMITHGQGVITFDTSPPFAPMPSWSGTNYFSDGMMFYVNMPRQEDYHDWLVIDPGNRNVNMPVNPSPYMFFFRQNSSYNYVSFNLLNGYSFGLLSVDLADTYAPSSTLAISFVGWLVGGGMVTNTFTMPSGQNTFQTYNFTSAFSAGLERVDILAPRWAMDNLVFGNVFPVPEPSTFALLCIGLAATCCRKTCCRHLVGRTNFKKP